MPSEKLNFKSAEKKDEKFSLDHTDLRLLDLLQHDASLSNQDLAEAAHTSPATCLRRVKRLVDSGVIERRVAILSPERLGAGLTVIAEVTLDRQGAEHLLEWYQRLGFRHVGYVQWNDTNYRSKVLSKTLA